MDNKEPSMYKQSITKEEVIEIAIKLQKKLVKDFYEWDCEDADERVRAMRICITAFLEPFRIDYYDLEKGGYFG